MNAYEILYSAANLPVPELDPLEWSSCEMHDEPNRYTIQVMVIDDDGFNQIKIFVANYSQGMFTVDAHGEFKLLLKTRVTQTINFKGTIIDELVNSFLVVPYNEKLRVLHRILDVTKVRAKSYADIIDILRTTYPKLKDVTDHMYSKLLTEDTALSDKKYYINSTLFKMSSKNVFGSLYKSIRVTEDGFEIDRYTLGESEKSTFYFDMNRNYEANLEHIENTLYGSYVINDLGFSLYFSK